MNTTKPRNSNVDLIKCIAVFSVICVHFFLNSNFYGVTVDNNAMSIMTAMRTLFMVCVPLFILTTGYLMINKELSLKYYKGIIKTISIYLIASLFCLAYKYFYIHDKITLKSAIYGILGFYAAPYSWYIDMYIGLFIIIPFLNILFNNLKNNKQRFVFIISLICITILPSLFNYSQKFYPNFFVSMYPITYYFTGSFVRKSEKEYLNKWWYLALFLVIIVTSSFVNMYISYDEVFKQLPLNNWEGIENYLSATFLFIFLIKLNLEKIPKSAVFILKKISEYSLGIYLLSFIADNLIYTRLNSTVFAMPEKLKYFVIVVGCVFLISLLLSIIANFIYYIICKLCRIIYHIMHNQSNTKRF